MERAIEGARRPRVLLIVAALAATAAGAPSPSGWTPAGADTAAPAGYDSAETRRFAFLYEQAAGSSATLLARGSATSG